VAADAPPTKQARSRRRFLAEIGASAAGEGRRLERGHYALVAASLVVLCWQLRRWNLLFPPA